jgi:hypothetical protein
MSCRRACEDVSNFLKSEFEIEWRLQRCPIMTRFPLVVDCEIWEGCPDKVRTRFARTADDCFRESQPTVVGALSRSPLGSVRPRPVVRHCCPDRRQLARDG